MIKEVLLVLVMLSSIPVGWFLAKVCKEELVGGRKWFVLILIGCLLFIFILLFLRIDYWLEMILGLVYLGVVSEVGLKLSYNKKFVKEVK